MTVPYDAQAELETIGVALSSDYPRPDLTPDQFYVVAHRELWAIILTLTDRPIRGIHLPEHLRPLARKASTNWDSGSPTRAVQRVADCATARSVLAAVHDLNLAAEDVDLPGVYDIVADIYKHLAT